MYSTLSLDFFTADLFPMQHLLYSQLQAHESKAQLLCMFNLALASSCILETQQTFKVCPADSRLRIHTVEIRANTSDHRRQTALLVAGYVKDSSEYDTPAPLTHKICPMFLPPKVTAC